MDNQGTPQAGSSNAAASDGTQLNPQAVNLAKAIRLQEGGGQVNYSASGDGGSSKGAYQFHDDNFKNWAQQYGLDPNDFSPVNQDKVAYHRINDLLQQGRAPSEVAAMWNGAKEVGGKMTPINPAYVEGVKRYYGQVVSGQGADSAIPNQQTPTQGPAKSGLTGVPVVDSVANFLFPIAGDIKEDVAGTSRKTVTQQAADLGLSALPLIPGIGEAGEAVRGAGLAERAIASPLVRNAALGYGYGALSNVSQGQDVGQAVSPNMGTLGGAALGGVAGSVLPKLFAPFTKNLTAGGAQSALETSIGSEARRLKPTSVLMSGLPDKGDGAIRTIARTPGATPEVVDNHHFDTTASQKVMQQRAGQLSQLRAQALTKMGTQFSLDDLHQAAIKHLEKGAANAPDLLQRKEQLAQTISDYTKNYGGSTIHPLQMEAIKEVNPYASPIARAARTALETATEKAGAPDLRALNKEIQKHINAQQILKKMNGQVVKGGRLGNMLRGHTAAAVGGIAGEALGGGWLGTIGGALAGEGLSKMLSHWSANTSFTTPLQQSILDRLATEDPSIVRDFSKYASSPQTTPVSVSPQRKTPTKSPTSGIMRNLLISGAARTPAKTQ